MIHTDVKYRIRSQGHDLCTEAPAVHTRTHSPFPYLPSDPKLTVNYQSLRREWKGWPCPNHTIAQGERKGYVSVLSLQNVRTKTRVFTPIVTQPHVCLAHTTQFNLRLKACGCTYRAPTPNYPSHISTCKCMTAHAASHTCIQHIQT